MAETEIKRINGRTISDDTARAAAKAAQKTADAITVPAKTSDLQNDSGFITRLVADLTNYYTKSQTYTQAEVNALVSAIPKFAISVVASLPTSGISGTTVYLVKSGSDADLYTEYIYVDGAWEILGSQRVDLTGYATEAWVNSKLADYLPAAQLQKAINAALAQAKESGEFDGAPGAPGVSPTVSVSAITGGHRITITDKNGTKTVDVMDGADGDPGEPGSPGDPGRGIVSVVRTSGTGAAGTTDTYTITYTDNTTSTFNVYNGKDGDPYTLTAADKQEIAEAAAEIVDVPAVDDTLKMSGAAADAAKVGEELSSLSEAIADLGGGKSVVDNAIGTTFPPSQRDADSRIDGSDIHMDLYLDGDGNLMPADGATSDDIHTYIDTVTDNLKNRVIKELLGKDTSGNFDMMRYTVCNRQHIAWQKQHYPKMYAWKNGDTTMYTESVSPRIGDNAYENPYVSESGTSTEIVNVPAKAVIIRGQRYSQSGGAFSEESTCATLVIPTEFYYDSTTGAAHKHTLALTNATFHTTRTGWYIGDDKTTFPRSATRTNINGSSVTVGAFGSVDYGQKYGAIFLAYDGSDTFENTTLTIDGVSVDIIVTDSAADSVKVAHATTEEVETEGAVLPTVTAVSATNRTRTIGGVVYTRYEDGDVEPTLIYTDVDDDRNASETITKGGITYIRYPLGDLLANKKKPIPIFVYANEHGVRSTETVGNGKWETKLCALVAARMIRDFGLEKQSQNPLYKYILENCMLIVIPVVNPYGFNHYLTDVTMGDYDGYCNSTGCNINRNYDCPGYDVMNPSGTNTEFGAYVGSENETQYVMNTMVESGAVVAMSLHGVGGFIGYCAHQGQNPNPNATGDSDKYVDYNQAKLAKVYDILFDTYGIKLRYYDLNSDGTPAVCINTPDITSKSPSYISQCGAYGGIVEFQPVKAGGVMGEHSMEQVVIETAYCQTLNLMAMWLSDYLDNQQ